MSNEFLRDELINVVVPYLDQDNLENVKMLFNVILSRYQISKKSTEIIPYDGDVNEGILKKFLCAKIAHGCSRKTIHYYGTTVKKALQDMGKPYTDVTADDVRLYIAIRVQRDKITKVTANNERRALSSFYGWLQKEEILLKKSDGQGRKSKRNTREKEGVHRHGAGKNPGGLQKFARACRG